MPVQSPGLAKKKKTTYFFGLNMLLVPIKLRPFKFNPCLILIVLLVPTKNYALGISPCSIQICLIYA